MQRFLFFFLLLACFSCKNEPTNTPVETPTISLPNQPEAVVRQWQIWVDNNDFAKAELLSTTRAKEWLGMLQQFLQEEQDTSTFTTDFKELNCYEKGDAAKCGYMLIEEGETFRDTFLLFKENGQWLVDIQEEMTEQDVKEMEALIDSLMQVQ